MEIQVFVNTKYIIILSFLQELHANYMRLYYTSAIDTLLLKPGYLIYMYMKPELEMPKNTEWQEQISHNSVPNAFQSLPWSLHGQIVKELSIITKYSPEGRDQWWSLFEFFTKLMLNSEINLMFTAVMSECGQFVAKVINHWHLNHGLWLVNGLHTHRSLWIC